MALTTANIGARVILVFIPQPNKEIPFEFSNSTYAEASALEVALLVFCPKSFKVNCKLKLSRMPFTNAEIGPFP